MNSYRHLHKFHGSWVNPFMDQIAPHVCTLLLLRQKQTNCNLYLSHFNFKFFWWFMNWERFMTLRSNHHCSKKSVFIPEMCIFSANIIYSTRPGYATFTSAMLYSVHHARGMDTIPCGNDKRSNKWESKPKKCWGECNRFYWQVQ